MAKTPSNMLELGVTAPNFTLPDVVGGSTLTLHDDKTPVGTVIAFICNHCPFVIHIQKALMKIANIYIPQNIRFIAINSNDVTHYSDDSPENMKRVAKEQAYPFPYVFDETQNVAKDYDAACTPDFYLFDQKLELVYRGEFDASRPSNTIPPTGNRLSTALDCLLLGQVIDIPQRPSLGCNIKWK